MSCEEIFLHKARLLSLTKLINQISERILIICTESGPHTEEYNEIHLDVLKISEYGDQLEVIKNSASLVKDSALLKLIKEFLTCVRKEPICILDKTVTSLKTLKQLKKIGTAIISIGDSDSEDQIRYWFSCF